MRILFDIAHPAHVHFYRHLHAELTADGHTALVVARDKDVTLALLREFGIEHVSVGGPRSSRLVPMATELIKRDIALWRIARRFQPDLLLTRNPAGVQAARLAGITGVFDTDDGSAAGIHFHLARPFADWITTPDCLREDYGRKHRTYPGYKALAYLHPNRFTPDPTVRDEIGLDPDEPLFFLRFAAYMASHDLRSEGIAGDLKRRLVAELATAGRVVISSEAKLEAELEPYRVHLPTTRIHDLLAEATLYIGDSQTVAAEAAVLGTPAIRMSSFSERLDYLRELEDRYGLIINLNPGEGPRLLREVEGALRDQDGIKYRAMTARSRMLEEKTDVTTWYRDLVDDIAGK